MIGVSAAEAIIHGDCRLADPHRVRYVARSDAGSAHRRVARTLCVHDRWLCYAANIGRRGVTDWFCGQCGKPNDDEDGFCISCGAKRKLARVPQDSAPRSMSRVEDSLPRPVERRVREAKASKHEAAADYMRMATLQVAHELSRPRQSTMAVLALLCAIGGIISVFVISAGAVVPILLGFALGRAAIKEIDGSRGQLTGRSGAVAAVWVGWLTIGLIAFFLVLLASGAIK